MKIFDCRMLKELDRYTMEHEPITSLDLMERAAEGLTSAIAKRWNKQVPIVIFAGPGNNGGDALAVARMLTEKDYRVEAFLFNTTGHLSEECTVNRDLLHSMGEKLSFTEVTKQFKMPELTEDKVLVDGLFGSGLDKPLLGGFAQLVKFINASECKVVSIDIPSGLNGDGNRFDVYPNVIVKANLTLTIQLPKLAFFFPENEDLVGELEIIDIGLSTEGMVKLPSKFSLLEIDDMKELVKPRKEFAHKGMFGHALLIAGSYGMAGASILSAKACLHSGVGLLTVHAPSRNLPILQIAVPEAIVEPDVDESAYTTPVYSDDFQAVAIGPGLRRSEETVEAFLQQIKDCQSPLVLDADALNILSLHKEVLRSIPHRSILTPHQGELERLTGKCANSFDRLQATIQLASDTQSYIILKGAYSVIVSPDGSCAFNPTGNPGMATGGSGDVLTGVILALLAQGYESLAAAQLGTYVHGLAGDMAAQKWGMMGMTAMNIVEELPLTWKSMENK